jgi:hypothetical protein
MSKYQTSCFEIIAHSELTPPTRVADKLIDAKLVIDYELA